MSLTTDRTTYIGGSDIVAIMGLDSDYDYANWTAVWNKFTQKIQVDFDEERGDIVRGNVLEPFIERWIRDSGFDPTINDDEMFLQFDTENDINDVSWDPKHDGGNPWNTKHNCRTQIFVRDSGHQYEYLGGHVDGIGHSIIHEMKAPRIHNIEYMQTYGVKWQYIVQVQFYMMLTNRTTGWIHVWDYDSWEPMSFKVYADQDLWTRMRSTCEYFWGCVQQNELPSIEWQAKMGYTHLFTNEELNEVIKEVYEAREMKKAGDALERKLKPKLMGAVRAIWQDDQPKVQLSTSDWLVKGSEYKRGDSLVTRITIKENEIKGKIESIN